jgi:hypothetical protein
MPESCGPTCATRVMNTVGYPAATRLSTKGSPVKVLSRFASPAGFALVLLLFFLLPFVSVSCDLPDYGRAGADYTGSHLVSGTEPEVSEELRDFANDPETPRELVNPPDPGVQVLAIVLAVLAAAGVLTVLVPRAKTRLLTGAGLATATLAVTVLTMVLAQSHLQSAVIDGVRRSGLADQQDTMRRVEDAAGDLTHSEVAFWLMVFLLVMIIAFTVVVGLFGDRLRSSRSNT